MTDKKQQDDDVIKLLRELQEALGDDFQKISRDEIEGLRRALPHFDVVEKLFPHVDYLVELAIDGKAARRVWQNNKSRILAASAIIAAVLALVSGAERFGSWLLILLDFGG